MTDDFELGVMVKFSHRKGDCILSSMNLPVIRDTRDLQRAHPANSSEMLARFIPPLLISSRHWTSIRCGLEIIHKSRVGVAVRYEKMILEPGLLVWPRARLDQ